MATKKETFERILSKSFSNENFTLFIREMLTGITLVDPDHDKPEYSNFSYYVKSHRHIGTYESDEGDRIAVFSVCLNKDEAVERARGMQRNFVKSLLENSGCAGAIVAFYTNGELQKWRLSFVRLEFEFAAGKVKEKLTPAKRYSYLVGSDEPCNTAKQQLFGIFENDNSKPGLDALEEAFSVEKVTKEFFDLYAEKYQQLREYLESNHDFTEEAAFRGFSAEQFAKKLMGQIVFLYFIQKKGWLGVNAIPVIMTEKEYKNAFFARGSKSRDIVSKVYFQQSDGSYKIDFDALKKLPDEDEDFLAGIVHGSPWGSGPKDFMRRTFNGCIDAGKNYFDDYLEPLFYTGLNLNRGENGYYPPLHRRIPFLNGGLFEQLENYEWEHNNFAIPNEIFSNKAEKGERDADGILDIFDRYNFTMSEDEPMEREVAIDPEMLGKVFENLLDITDRKSKGAFYTPREIVHYMCQETLIKYLQEKTGISEKGISDFIMYGDFFKDEDTEKTKKVSDGNGKYHYEIDKEKDLYISEEIFSFKKGVNRLEEIDKLLQNVKVADLAVGSGAFPLGMLNEIVKARETLTSYLSIGMTNFQKKSFIAYGRKLYDLKVSTIKNCIFACDIEPSAADIAKLRLWLSIVIDDEIAADAGNGEFDAHTKPRQLPNLECNILCGNSLIDEFMGNVLITKSAVLGNDDNYQYNIFNSSGVDALIKKLIELQDRLFFIKDHNEKEEIKAQIQEIYNQIILEQIGMDPEMSAAYYESLKSPSKPFILWQLYFPKVFKENGGFDIIIGNPPYIKERDNSDVFNPVNNTAFGKLYHQGKMDYWYYFLHRAIDLTAKDGHISFITPRYWINGAGASNLIKRIKKELSFDVIVDIGKLKVFDNVVGLHMISQYSKNKHENFVYKKLENSLVDLTKSTDTENLSISTLNNEDAISESYEIVLEKRVGYENTIELGSIADISQGVVEASDRISNRMYSKNPREDMHIGQGIFVLSQSEIDELGFNEDEKKLLVPYADGNEMSRYSLSDHTSNYLIYSDKEIKELIANDEKYIHIKRHLDYMAEYITSSNKPYGIHRPRQRKYFESPKIIMPSMFAENGFVIDYNYHYYVGMSFQCIVLNDDNYLIEYILAVLNSSVAREWFYSYGKKRGAGVDIGVDKIRSFPIMPCDISTQKDIAEKVRKLLDNYTQNIDLDKEIDDTINSIYGR